VAAYLAENGAVEMVLLARLSGGPGGMGGLGAVYLFRSVAPG
jgi:hypothetical protein